jgi:hypothetical protein
MPPFVKVILLKAENGESAYSGDAPDIVERQAAFERLAGCLEGCPLTLEEAKEERLAKYLK